MGGVRSRLSPLTAPRDTGDGCSLLSSWFWISWTGRWFRGVDKSMVEDLGLNVFGLGIQGFDNWGVGLGTLSLGLGV